MIVNERPWKVPTRKFILVITHCPLEMDFSQFETKYKENKEDVTNQEHFNCESGTKFYSKTTVQSGQVSCN